MRRIFFNTAAILSLLLWLFLIYSWPRSYLPRRLVFESIDGSLMLLTWNGVNSDLQDQSLNPESEKFAGIRGILQYMSRASDQNFLGFRSIRGGGIYRGV